MTNTTPCQAVYARPPRTVDTLISHLAQYAHARYGPAPPAQESESTLRTAARQIIEQDISGSAAKARSMSGPRIIDDLQRKLGLGEVEADDLVRDLALERIWARPGVYLNLLLENVQRVFAGQPTDLA